MITITTLSAFVVGVLFFNYRIKQYNDEIKSRNAEVMEKIHNSKINIALKSDECDSILVGLKKLNENMRHSV